MTMTSPLIEWFQHCGTPFLLLYDKGVSQFMIPPQGRLGTFVARNGTRLLVPPVEWVSISRGCIAATNFWHNADCATIWILSSNY